MPSIDPTEIPGWTFAEFSERLLKIKDKQAQIVPFKLNVVQERVDKIVQELIDAGQPVRIIILKARQQGMSTWSLGRMYHTATTQAGTDAMMICHDDDSSVTLFNRLKMMYDFAPIKPMTKYSTRRELDFRNPDSRQASTRPGLLSRCALATAGRPNVGRSATLRYLHLSEVAMWKDADSVLLGLEQALPNVPGTVEIIESTAKGVGNEFHVRWERTQNPATAGGWVGIFIPWWEHPDYAISVKENDWHPIPSSVADLDDFESDEKDQKKLYGLTDDQLNWRRFMIVNYCGNSVEKFHQEYPGTASEAFLTSGRPVFNQAMIQRRIEVLKKADEICRERRKGPRFEIGNLRLLRGAANWVSQPDGPLRIYDWPEAQSDYLIGGDVAEGIVKGSDGDESVATVIDRHTWKQVAVYQGKITPARFGVLLEILGYFYNEALIACEVNNHGHTVNNYLEQHGYPNVFYRRDFDKLGNPVFEKMGWDTNRKTRPLLVDALDEAVNRNLCEINHIPMLEQMLRFVNNEKTGKQEGAPGCHDDCVIAQGIALAVMNYSDQAPVRSSKLRDPADPGAALHQKFIKLAFGQARSMVKSGRWLN